MSLLTIFVGIAVLVWFYLTAKDKGENRFNWAIVGVTGYWLTWCGVKLMVVLSGFVAKSTIMAIIVNLLPVLCAIGAAFLIRKKLLADVAEK